MSVNGLDNPLLGRLLHAATRRHQVIASNISNQNVPGYRRKTLEFESLLQDALTRRSSSLEGIEPRVVTDTLTPPRADGNNVTLELEMNLLRQNQLLYETYMSIGAARVEMIRASIQDDR